MTTPYGPPPDSALVFGGRYNQDITEESARNMMTGQAGTLYTDAGNSWIGVKDDVAGLAGEVKDGQLELTERVDLIESVSGYCSTFMSRNWTVAGNTRVTLPFDTQLGPNKGATPFQGGILMDSKGLWRCDAHVSFYPPTSGWGTTTVSAAVFVSVYYIGTGTVYTEREFDIVISPQGAETAAFSDTFVIPTDNTFAVRVQVRHGKTSANIYGGTLRSALSVNRWDTGTANALVLDTAPDGGTLS
ncbi:hypothetical protein [Rhodococcoides fascians]|uniref:hypothetical protein n=1 Tax=Rhodococcoides fascians TaxID=1828 RepID=UPI00050C5CA0|nr:hypothetical protein [Rhodococcus fascians]